MKLCVSTLGCPTDTVDEMFARLISLGVDGVEIRTVAGTINLWEIDAFAAENIAQTRKRFEEANICVVDVGTSSNFASADSEKRAQQIENLVQYAKVAQGLNCQYLRVFGGPIPEGVSREEAIVNNIEGYRQAIQEIAPYGVTLLFETHDDYCLSSTLLPILKELPETGVIWDILHPYRCGETMRDTWENLKPYIRHVHIKDSFGFSDSDFDIAHIGEGDVPIQDALNILKEANYDGYLSYEWEKHWHPEIDSADIAFPKYMAYMKKCL